MIKFIPLVFLCALLTKLLIIGCTFTDAPIFLILASLTAFYELKLQDKPVNDLQTKMIKMEKELEDLRGYVGAMKLGQSVRFTNNTPKG